MTVNHGHDVRPDLVDFAVNEPLAVLRLVGVGEGAAIEVKGDDVFVMINQNGIVEEVISSKRTENLEFRFWPFGD